VSTVLLLVLFLSLFIYTHHFLNLAGVHGKMGRHKDKWGV
jgi:hypothetical protein